MPTYNETEYYKSWGKRGVDGVSAGEDGKSTHELEVPEGCSYPDGRGEC